MSVTQPKVLAEREPEREALPGVRGRNVAEARRQRLVPPRLHGLERHQSRQPGGELPAVGRADGARLGAVPAGRQSIPALLAHPNLTLVVIAIESPVFGPSALGEVKDPNLVVLLLQKRVAQTNKRPRPRV